VFLTRKLDLCVPWRASVKARALVSPGCTSGEESHPSFLGCWESLVPCSGRAHGRQLVSSKPQSRETETSLLEWSFLSHSKGVSYHSCHILMVRSKSQFPPTHKRKEYNNVKLGDLRACQPHYPLILEQNFLPPSGPVHQSHLVHGSPLYPLSCCQAWRMTQESSWVHFLYSELHEYFDPCMPVTRHYYGTQSLWL
jgi:hypothetical protein